MGFNLHKLQVQLLDEMRKLASPGKQGARYSGTPHKYYGLKAIDRKTIAKKFQQQNDLSQEELVKLLNLLYSGKSHEEKLLAGEFLRIYVQYRQDLDLSSLESWLGELVGWSEIDGTCQSNFSGNEVLGRWTEWQKLLDKLRIDPNINKRRASLVLLVKPIREIKDKRLINQAFTTIGLLQHEPDILLTKAISWLLREMVKLHKSEVQAFLEIHGATLPRVAVRETWKKIKTGLK